MKPGPNRLHLLVFLAALCCTPALPVAAQTAPPKPGVVILHGKGGGPDRLVLPMARELQDRGFAVANLEMPWSGRRNYDVDVASAEQQVTAALKELQAKGAKKLFVAGHSQGAVFALHYASRHALDGLVILAPGGNVASRFYQQQVGRSVDRARDAVTAGKGAEPGEFDEFEGGKGFWTVRTTAAVYLSWFDPDGAMNQLKSSAALPKTLPVLHVAPTSDYPALLRAKQEMFDAIASPLKKLYAPDASHTTVPRVAAGEVANWIAEVAAK